MRKVVLAVLLVAAFVLPCFAADAEPPSSDDILDQIIKDDVASTSTLLLTTGRANESPVLLAAAAELLKGHDIKLQDEDGKEIDADSVYAEAMAAAKKADNSELAEALDKQSRLEAGRHGSHRRALYGWYYDYYGRLRHGLHRHR